MYCVREGSNLIGKGSFLPSIGKEEMQREKCSSLWSSRRDLEGVRPLTTFSDTLGEEGVPVVGTR